MTPLVNRVAGGLLMAASLAYFAPTLDFAPPPPSSTDPGMSLWPQALAIAGFFAACALAVLPEHKSMDPAPQDGDETDDQQRYFGPALIGIGLTIVYITLMKAQLYFIATPIYVAALLWICGARHPLMIIGIALGTEFVAYFLFFRLLGVPLLSV